VRSVLGRSYQAAARDQEEISVSISKGDLVQLVWACCAKGRRHLGWTGVAGDIAEYNGSECWCGHKTYGMHAWINIGGDGVVPLSWLIKIEPPAVTTERREEITA
jgi:hypothetical protein